LLSNARLGASSSKPSLSPSTTCYSFARSQSMIKNSSNLTSDVEFEIDYSKVHWSKMDPTPNIEDFQELNHTYFLVLKQKYSSRYSGHFLKKRDDIVIGKKIV